MTIIAPAFPSLVEQYLNDQRFNGLVAWLHAQRYRRIKAVLTAAQLPAGAHLLDIGCGPATLFAELHNAIGISYTGIDINSQFVEMALKTYGTAHPFKVIEADITVSETFKGLGSFDVVAALETFEHLRPAHVSSVLANIRGIMPRYFICSVPIETGPAIAVKNVGSWLMGYSRHREYSLADTLWSTLGWMDKVRPWSGGHRGFDWRIFEREVRKHFTIKRRLFLPSRHLSMSVMFVCGGGESV